MASQWVQLFVPNRHTDHATYALCTNNAAQKGFQKFQKVSRDPEYAPLYE